MLTLSCHLFLCLSFSIFSVCQSLCLSLSIFSVCQSLSIYCLYLSVSLSLSIYFLCLSFSLSLKAFVINFNWVFFSSKFYFFPHSIRLKRKAKGARSTSRTSATSRKPPSSQTSTSRFGSWKTPWWSDATGSNIIFIPSLLFLIISLLL
jgi:hypothetical protein